MKTIFSVQGTRQLISATALPVLALGMVFLLTACEPDPQPQPPADQTERQQQDDQDRRLGDQQRSSDDAAFRDDQRQNDPMMRDGQRAGDDAMARDDRQTGRQTDRQQGDRAQDRQGDTGDGFPGGTAQQATRSEDLVGSTVRSRIEDREIGRVEEVLLDHNNNPLAVVVDVGEFLDTDRKLVALEWNRISLQDSAMQPGARGATAQDRAGQQREARDQGLTVVADTTREQLESAQDFDRQAWEAQQRTDRRRP